MKNGWLRAALVLAAGALIPACGGNSGGGPGGLVLNLSGGEGTEAYAGNGGYFQASVNSAADGKILRSGSVDAAFTTPGTLPALGANPEDVMVNTTWEVGDELASNDNYVTNGSGVTGLRVRPGVTLTVKPNTVPSIAISSVAIGGVYTMESAVPSWIFVGANLVIRDCSNAANNGTFAVQTIGASNDFTVNNASSVVEAADSPGSVDGLRQNVSIGFSHGVIVEGTLVVDYQDLSTQGDSLSSHRAGLTIDCYNLVVAAGGRIVLTGRDNPLGTNGGSGGGFGLYTDGSVIVRGTVDASGGDGDSGGLGGGMEIIPEDGNAYLTGTLDASGGRALGPAGQGGWGGTIEFGPDDFGGVFVSGTIRTRGGDGPAGGSNGGAIYVVSGDLGDVAVSGTLDSSGGDATSNGDGGTAGQIVVGAYGGTARVKGTLDLSGGNGPGGNGGSSNSLYLWTSPTEVYWEVAYKSTRGLYVGATIHANGGTGSAGGSGGTVVAYTDDASGDSNNTSQYSEPGMNPLVFVGYREVRTSGGNGFYEGGNAGNIEMVNYGQYLRDVGIGTVWFMGGVRNEADLLARGGESDEDDAGIGGNVELYEYMNDSDPAIGGSLDREAANAGRIDVGGGSGPFEGGRAGDVYLYGFYNAANAGAILANGGNGGENRGGYGGQIYLATDHRLNNSGSLSANGGDSVDDEGGRVDTWGNGIYLAGLETVTTGNLSANGGDSVNGFGGNSGPIEVYGFGVASRATGTFQSNAGTGGADDGLRSRILVLGVLIQASEIP